mgnify:CR=1 FL=1
MFDIFGSEQVGSSLKKDDYQKNPTVFKLFINGKHISGCKSLDKALCFLNEAALQGSRIDSVSIKRVFQNKTN